MELGTEKNSNGSYKVGIGCQLKLRVHCEVSSALVIKLETIKAISALTIIYNLKIKQFDVKCAYLHNKINEEVYVIMWNNSQDLQRLETKPVLE